VKGISIHIFIKKSKFYKVCNDSKSNVCFNILVGFGN
jgi:hypothetical protein